MHLLSVPIFRRKTLPPSSTWLNWLWTLKPYRGKNVPVVWGGLGYLWLAYRLEQFRHPEDESSTICGTCRENLTSIRRTKQKEDNCQKIHTLHSILRRCHYFRLRGAVYRKVINVKLERIWKETILTYSRYFTWNCLKGLRKLPIISVVRGVLVEIQTRRLWPTNLEYKDIPLTPLLGWDILLSSTIKHWKDSNEMLETIRQHVTNEMETLFW